MAKSKKYKRSEKPPKKNQGNGANQAIPLDELFDSPCEINELTIFQK